MKKTDNNSSNLCFKALLLSPDARNTVSVSREWLVYPADEVHLYIIDGDVRGCIEPYLSNDEWLGWVIDFGKSKTRYKSTQVTPKHNTILAIRKAVEAAVRSESTKNT